MFGILLGIAAGLVLFIYLGSRNIDDRTREWVIRDLSARFDSQVDLQSLHVETTPRMQVTGEGLTLRYRNRTDVAPLIQIARFSFNLGFLGIVHVPRHVKGVYVENMVITIPPSDPNAAPPSAKSAQVPHIFFNEIVCNDTSLIILPKKAGKIPLDFKIHDLVLTNVGKQKPFDFHGTLTNAKPKGEIATNGTFGPWNAEDPASTPVSGGYNFSNADLDPFAGIGGTLSSTGKYTGQPTATLTSILSAPRFSTRSSLPTAASPAFPASRATLFPLMSTPPTLVSRTSFASPPNPANPS